MRGSEPTAAFAPSGPTGESKFLAERLALAGLVLIVALNTQSGFVTFPRTNWITWVGCLVLAGLVVVCAPRPVVERLLAARGGRLRVPALAAVVAVGLGAGVLVVAGMRARTAGAVAVPVAGARFAGPAAAIPRVAIDPGVQRIDTSITPPLAQAMGQDVVGDLAARGPAVYVFDRMTVVVVTNLLRPQDAPRIGMAVHGTRNGAAYVATFVLNPLPGGHYEIGSELAP